MLRDLYRLPVDHETLDFLLVMAGLLSFCSLCISVSGLIGDLSRFL